ncbi:MAG: beta-aspartyl-peptidase [Desulfobacterales bacterium]|nr:beta-aspartyl-peptidase [Desulfobacterales bacterium]
MIIIKHGEVFSPEALGRKDILVGGGRILAMEDSIDPSVLPGKVEVIDAQGFVVTPGFIDGHQHFTGGGGEGGFQTRTPEMSLTMNTQNGVTTAVGLLGTDSLTRTVENLYAKTQAFNAEGITAYMLTGSYWYPSPAICGSAERDLTYNPRVLGVKLALSDIRGPHMGVDDLASLCANVRVAALVADKPGIITVHTGILPERLEMVAEVVKRFSVRADMFVPTHINRKDEELVRQAMDLAKKGAHIDATCMTSIPDAEDRHMNAADMALTFDEAGLFDQVTFSSDAGGSLPKWNEEKSRIIGMGVGQPDSLRFELNLLVNQKGMELSKALCPLTMTPAKVYGLDKKKGRVAESYHADLLVMDPATMEIRDVLAKGEIMVRNNQTVRRGYFE